MRRRANIVESLNHQLDETLALLKAVSETGANFPYAPDKWSVKQVVGHIMDAERIFAYRALRFAREDRTELPGLEGDGYVNKASFDDYTLDDLTAELKYVSQATHSLFKHLKTEAWDRRGVAGGNEFTVRALAYIIAGHELQHREVLRTRYLGDRQLS